MQREDELIERDIEAYLERHAQKDILRFLTCGSVDDGKSTLIGRLLFDVGAVYDDQLAALRKDSQRRGVPAGELDYSLLVDGLLSEREQGITIDVAYRHFATAKRKFIIADTPGHEQYTRNMATGASTAELAVILVDARQGVLRQTRRHSYIAALLGIRHVVVAVNKMDLVGYDPAVFETIRAAYSEVAARLSLREVQYIPLSALTGANVATRASATMPWYQGPTLLEHLETVPIARDRDPAAGFRLPVQYVIRPDLDFRGFAGTIAAGVVRRGDPVVALPSGATSHVRAIVTYDGELAEATAPMAVTVALDDEIDVSRGDTLARPDARPTVARALDATVVWMHERPLRPGAVYLLKHGTRATPAEVVRVAHAVDVNTFEPRAAAELGLNDIGAVALRAARPLVFDPYTQHRATGAFILIDRMSFATVGAGMITGATAEEDAPAGSARVTPAERARRLGQTPFVLWLGTDGALAAALERGLFDAGHAVAVVDAATLETDPVTARGAPAVDVDVDAWLLAATRWSVALGHAALVVAPRTDAALAARVQHAAGAAPFVDVAELGAADATGVATALRARGLLR